jgi:hypothetical protein
VPDPGGDLPEGDVAGLAESDTVVLHCTFRGRHTGEFMGLAWPGPVHGHTDED